MCDAGGDLQGSRTSAKIIINHVKLANERHKAGGGFEAREYDEIVVCNVLISFFIFEMSHLANPRCVSNGSLDHTGAAAFHSGGGCRQGVH